MALPSDFQFSQENLQDFVDCRRRFYLRYLLELDWPAIEVEPADVYEAQLHQADAFHRLVQQHQSGVPVELLARQTETDHLAEAGDLAEEEPPAPLAEWWRNYLKHPPANLPELRYSEVALSAPLHGYRLGARYDLIAVEPGPGKMLRHGPKAVIVDWKTWKRRPEQAWLIARMQTRVYRYLLVRAGAPLHASSAAALDSPQPADAGSRDRTPGQGIEPSQVEMVYWFANHPEDPERLPYDEELYQADEAFLTALVTEVEQATHTGSPDIGFPKTEDVMRCRFCVYRSFCNRGVEAGDLDESERYGLGDFGLDSEPTADLDLEQITEIAY